MFGKGVFQAEENLLREIIRSVDKKIDYSAREGEGSCAALTAAHRDDNRKDTALRLLLGG